MKCCGKDLGQGTPYVLIQYWCSQWSSSLSTLPGYTRRIHLRGKVMVKPCPTYFERFPSREDYEGCAKLIEWYGDKYPGLKAQWEGRRRLYEEAMNLL
jgi:hypothetical protein